MGNSNKRDPTDLVGRWFYSSELRDDDVMIEFASAQTVTSKKVIQIIIVQLIVFVLHLSYWISGN